MIGTRLGQYTIDARLGAGGMGVVYRAHDERLHRTVAIKIVGGTAATEGDRNRLLDEARAASHLSHPNICTVYEAGEVDGRAFIAMEYVEGASLATVIPHGGFPSETVVAYGSQIAGALAHAHDRGVLHRDLKTANIVIGESGAKVLDFGLARRVEMAAADVTTRSVVVAETRVLAGTLAYMPPETLMGQPGDVRSDIWSLGVVLFEMATGELPFRGRSEFELTAAILRAPAPPFPTHVPPILRSVILRCLAKEPAQRYQHAGEVRAALEAIQSDITLMPAAVPVRRRGPLLAVAAVTAIAAAAAAVWWFAGRRNSAWERGVQGRLTRLMSSEDVILDPALSPDGRLITYVMQSADRRVDVYVGQVKGGARLRLTNDDAAEDSPHFSADGEKIAYTSRAATDTATPEVRIVPALGGDVLSTIPHAANPAWARDGRLAYLRAAANGTQLVVSKEDGAEARVILAADSAYPFLRNPAWSIDARQVAIVRSTGGIAGEIWLVPVSGGAARRLLDEPAAIASDYPMFTPDGRGLVEASSRGGARNIWFVPLGGGKPVRLTTSSGADDSPTIAADGSIAFLNSRWHERLEAHDLETGSIRTLDTHTPFLWAPAVSPDGRMVAFTRGEVDGSWHLWTVPMEGGPARRVSATEAGEMYPRWSADGAALFFSTWNTPRRVGRVEVGGGSPVYLPLGDGAAYADPSPDGRRIAFARADAASERLFVAPLDGGPATPLADAAGTTPRWSPDGTWIAFGANRSYTGGIFVMRPHDRAPRRLTTEGGWPVWFPDGRQIGYQALGAGGNEEIRVVSLEGGPARVLRIRVAGTNHPFAVAPDGRTLVVSNAIHLSDEIWLLEPRR